MSLQKTKSETLPTRQAMQLEFTKKAMSDLRDSLRQRQKELNDLQSELETLTDPMERAQESLNECIEALSEVV